MSPLLSEAWPFAAGTPLAASSSPLCKGLGEVELSERACEELRPWTSDSTELSGFNKPRSVPSGAFGHVPTDTVELEDLEDLEQEELTDTSPAALYMETPFEFEQKTRLAFGGGEASPTRSEARTWSADSHSNEEGIRGDGPAKWDTEQRIAYFRSLQLEMQLRNGQSAASVVERVFATLPLPTNWIAWHSSQGVYFQSQLTQLTSWDHPLDAEVRELTEYVSRWLRLPVVERNETLLAQKEIWEAETREMLAPWYTAVDESGTEYYCNKETRESRWEHPAWVVLPVHFLRVKTIEALLGDSRH